MCIHTIKNKIMCDYNLCMVSIMILLMISSCWIYAIPCDWRHMAFCTLFLMKLYNYIKLFFIIHLQLEKYDIQASVLHISNSDKHKRKILPTTYISDFYVNMEITKILHVHFYIVSEIVIPISRHNTRDWEIPLPTMST